MPDLRIEYLDPGMRLVVDDARRDAQGQGGDGKRVSPMPTNPLLFEGELPIEFRRARGFRKL
jgi:hypothetical protein